MPAATRSSSRPCRREGKIAHRLDRARAPPALSRPTRSCSCPLFTSFLPIGPVPTSTRLTQGPFRLPSRCCVIRAKTNIIPSRQPEHREPRKSLPRIAFFKRVGWGEKIWPVATLALAAKLASGSFFSAPIFLPCLGTDESCVLASPPPGIRWPYRRTCGFLAVHAMPVAQSLYRHQPCLLMVVFLSYLAESSGTSHITQQRRARRSVEHSQRRA
jgi:hypothetical protein